MAASEQPPAAAKRMKTDDAEAWRQLAAGIVIMFLSLGIVQTFTFLFESTRQELGIEITLFTWAFNIGMTVQFLVCLGVCKAQTYLSQRALLSIGGMMVAVGVLLCRFSYASWHIFICFSFFVGAGSGITTQTAYLMVNLRFDTHRGLAIGLLYSTAPLARMTLPLLEKFLEDVYGNRGSLLIMSAVLTHCIPAAMLIKDPPWSFGDDRTGIHAEPSNNETTSLRKPVKEEGGRGRRHTEAIRRVARKPIFWIFLVADSFFWLLFPNFTMLLPIFASTFLDRAQASWLITFTGCGDILARLVFPPLVDRRLLKPRTGYILGNFFGMLASGLVPFCMGSFWGMGISSLLYGVGSGISVCFGGLVLLHYFGLEDLPASTGLGWAIKGLVLLAFGPAIGGLRDLTGDFSASYFLLSGGMALGTLVWLLEYAILACRKGSKTDSFSPTAAETSPVELRAVKRLQ